MSRSPRILTITLLLAALPVAAQEPASPAEEARVSPGTDAPAPIRLTLDEAIARARAASPGLDSLRALESAGAAGVDRARSGRMPQVDLTASYTRRSDVPELAISPPGQPPQTIYPNIPDNWLTRIGVSLPLYTGGRTGSLIEAAEGERSAAGADTATGDADLALEATIAYWDLVTARASVRVLDDALRSYDAHVEDAENRKAQGLAAANEVLAVIVERDGAELARLRAENAAEAVEANLARLIGAPQGARIDPADTLGPAEATPAPASGPHQETIEALVAEALASRPERRALASRVEAAAARSRAARADRLPQVSFHAGYDYARPNRLIFPATDSWDDTWDASVMVGYRLFDGGRTSSEVAREEARSLALQRQLDQLDLMIRLQITQGLLELKTARSSVTVADRSLESARENRRVAAERYRAGVIPSSELLDAETALLRAGLERTRALAAVLTASARLDRSIGR